MILALNHVLDEISFIFFKILERASN